MYVKAGSVITYQFKAATTLSHPSGSDIENAVASDLSAAGLTVVDFTVVNPSLGVEIANIWGFTVQVTMKIKVSVDYGSEDDVKSIADHYVYTNTGSLPQASTVTNVTAPSGQTTQTGTPQDTSTGGGGGGGGNSFWDTITTFLSGAGVGGFLGIGLALVAVVLIVSLATSKKLIPGA